MSLHFKCPCGVMLEAPGGTGGRGGECPSCGKIVLVPVDAVSINTHPASHAPGAPAAAPVPVAAAVPEPASEPSEANAFTASAEVEFPLPPPTPETEPFAPEPAPGPPAAEPPTKAPAPPGGLGLLDALMQAAPPRPVEGAPRALQPQAPSDPGLPATRTPIPRRDSGAVRPPQMPPPVSSRATAATERFQAPASGSAALRPAHAPLPPSPPPAPPALRPTAGMPESVASLPDMPGPRAHRSSETTGPLRPAGTKADKRKAKPTRGKTVGSRAALTQLMAETGEEPYRYEDAAGGKKGGLKKTLLIVLLLLVLMGGGLAGVYVYARDLLPGKMAEMLDGVVSYWKSHGETGALPASEKPQKDSSGENILAPPGGSDAAGASGARP